MSKTFCGEGNRLFSGTALVDTGAMNSLGRAESSEEWERAQEVNVCLAGNQEITMRMTRRGTLPLPILRERIVRHRVSGSPGGDPPKLSTVNLKF